MYFFQKRERAKFLFSFFILFTTLISAGNSAIVKTGNVDLPKLFYLKGKGKLGDNLLVTIELNKTDSFIEGHYYYDKIGYHIELNGKIKRNGSFILEEFNKKGEVNGTFTGIFSSATSAEGIWKNKTGEKKFPFQINANYEGAAQIFFNDYSKKNCDRINFLKNKKDHEPSLYDTACSIHALIIPVTTLTDKNVEKRINESILNSFLPNENGKRQNITEYTSDIFENQGEYYQEKNESFSVSQNDKDVLSLNFEFNEYSEGAAHGSYGLTLMNFDLKTGKSISISDILLPGTEKKLNTIAEKLFYETNGKEDWFFEPGEFSVNNNFSLKPDGLWFVFNIYEIGPYSSGSPEVFIPFSQIKEIIRKDGILSRFNTK